MAMGYVRLTCTADNVELAVEIDGAQYGARVVANARYDPTGSRMRS
jgi:glycine cleavage system aminomethyltransferase T